MERFIKDHFSHSYDVPDLAREYSLNLVKKVKEAHLRRLGNMQYNFYEFPIKTQCGSQYGAVQIFYRTSF